MGMKMNKSSFIKELSKKTRYDEKTCILINEIIEKYFIFNKKNKEKLIQDLNNLLCLFFHLHLLSLYAPYCFTTNLDF